MNNQIEREDIKEIASLIPFGIASASATQQTRTIDDLQPYVMKIWSLHLQVDSDVFTILNLAQRHFIRRARVGQLLNELRSALWRLYYRLGEKL